MSRVRAERPAAPAPARAILPGDRQTYPSAEGHP
jgi:hypothetical protein